MSAVSMKSLQANNYRTKFSNGDDVMRDCKSAINAYTAALFTSSPGTNVKLLDLEAAVATLEALTTSADAIDLETLRTIDKETLNDYIDTVGAAERKLFIARALHKRIQIALVSLANKK